MENLFLRCSTKRQELIAVDVWDLQIAVEPTILILKPTAGRNLKNSGNHLLYNVIILDQQELAFLQHFCPCTPLLFSSGPSGSFVVVAGKISSMLRPLWMMRASKKAWKLSSVSLQTSEGMKIVKQCYRKLTYLLYLPVTLFDYLGVSPCSSRSLFVSMSGHCWLDLVGEEGQDESEDSFRKKKEWVGPVRCQEFHEEGIFVGVESQRLTIGLSFAKTIRLLFPRLHTPTQFEVTAGECHEATESHPGLLEGPVILLTKNPCMY